MYIKQYLLSSMTLMIREALTCADNLVMYKLCLFPLSIVSPSSLMPGHLLCQGNIDLHVEVSYEYRYYYIYV